MFGSLTSVATNVLHTFLPGVHMPASLALVIAARIGAAAWPIGLLLSIEVLARAQWRRGPAWAIARFGGAGTVALGSAVISYGHVRDVLLAWGYGHPAAEFGPLTLDGLMVVCGFALLSMTPTDTATTPIGRSRVNTTAVRPIRTLNPKQAVPREVSLTTQIEALTPPVRPTAEAVATVTGHPESAAGQVDTTAVAVDTEVDNRRTRAQELHAQGWTHGRIAAELAVSKRTVRRYVATGADNEQPVRGHADNTLDTPEGSEVDTAATDPSVPVPGWLAALDTNHHDNHEGVLA
ncbi:terminase gpP N-terminus-related DNA-binding protein [Nocardia sp. NBC_01327]|uniref:terminase gpP N-terminus-related DNA-binding protein n=1 Tax=Nocardia sp. NBC_01327 TaxID=2903593 RepID=UPI002E0EE0C4|nr:helix-turn-helix domain-containing protein [Nocardia sp. NBC_01327]